MLQLTLHLRRTGNQVLFLNPDVKITSLKQLISFASQQNVEYCLLYGTTELKNSTITIKNMDAHEQRTIPYEHPLDLALSSLKGERSEC